MASGSFCLPRPFTNSPTHQLTASLQSCQHERPPHRPIGEPGQAAIAEDDQEADQREGLHLGAGDLHHLAAHEGVQFLIADLATQIDAARLLVHRAATLLDSGAPAAEVTRATAMAKLSETPFTAPETPADDEG